MSTQAEITVLAFPVPDAPALPPAPAALLRHALQHLVLMEVTSPAFAATPGATQTLHRARLALLLVEAEALTVTATQRREAAEAALEAALHVLLVWGDPPLHFVIASTELFKSFLILCDADPTLCPECGGTILADSIGGAERGSCHCRPRPVRPQH